MIDILVRFCSTQSETLYPFWVDEQEERRLLGCGSLEQHGKAELKEGVCGRADTPSIKGKLREVLLCVPSHKSGCGDIDIIFSRGQLGVFGTRLAWLGHRVVYFAPA